MKREKETQTPPISESPAMASQEQQLTEYERRRLENIKRNDEMMASLKIQSRLSELSAVSKSSREEKKKKTYKRSSEKKPSSESAPIVIRRSLRARGMPPDSSGLPKDFDESPVKKKSKMMMEMSTKQPEGPFIRGPLTMSDAYQGDDSYRPFIGKFTSLATNGDQNSSDGKRRSVRVRSSSNLNLNDHGSDMSYSSRVRFERSKLEDPVDLGSLRLESENIARVVPGRIMVVRFFPTTDMRIVVAGNKYGNLGFWDLNAEGEEEDGNGIFLFQPHSAPVSGISVHPFSLSKMYTSCYNGLLRVMDIEKEMFELVYSSDSGSELFSLSQQPNNANSIYFGEGQGGLNMFDGRAGKICSSWSLHDGRINSVDFSAAATNLMATSSTDGLACIWDLRKMDVKQPKSKVLRTLHHKRAVHSAYFSPSGNCLATTSVDDSIGVLQGANFEDMFKIHHDNWTNRWISSFRAVWGWDDTYLYVGNMKRRVDVVSVSQRKTVYALDSPLMSAIPCRYDAHPCVVGTLAGATGGGQVYVWTSSS